MTKEKKKRFNNCLNITQPTRGRALIWIQLLYSVLLYKSTQCSTSGRLILNPALKCIEHWSQLHSLMWSLNNVIDHEAKRLCEHSQVLTPEEWECYRLEWLHLHPGSLALIWGHQDVLCFVYQHLLWIESLDVMELGEKVKIFEHTYRT